MPTRIDEPDPVAKPKAVPRLSAVAFSGGGFRATLFHLGVLLWLLKQKLLSRDTRIYGVSGGAILAAHLGVHWHQYERGGEDLQGCLRSLLTLIRRDLRNRVFRRWLAFYAVLLTAVISVAIATWINRVQFADTWWSIGWLVLAGATTIIFALTWWLKLIAPVRTRLLEAQYGSFLFTKHTGLKPRPLTLADLNLPVHLAATSLTTGQLICFANNHIIIYKRDYTEEARVNKQRYTLARAVCSSSAFPPAFMPVPLDKAEMGMLQDGRDHALTDGGIHDNLGIQLLRATSAGNQPLKPLRALVSDAGRPFGYSPGSFRGTLRRNMRANDLLMYRVADHDFESFEDHLKDGYALETCRIYPDDPHKMHTNIDNGIQLKIARIRTDLDAFSDDEIYMLVRHGADSAAHIVRGGGDRLPDEEIRSVCGLTRDADVLAAAFEKRYGEKSETLRKVLGGMSQFRRLFIGRDRVVLLWAFPILCAVLAVSMVWVQARRVLPHSLHWSELESTHDVDVDVILISLIEKLKEQRPGLCVLASDPIGQALESGVPADFRVVVPYKSVKRPGASSASCWLFVQRFDGCQRPEKSYSEIAAVPNGSKFSFTICDSSSQDRLILVAFPGDGECQRLSKAIGIEPP